MRTYAKEALVVTLACAGLGAPAPARAEEPGRLSERDAIKREIAAALAPVLGAARAAASSAPDPSWTRALGRTASHADLWAASSEDMALALSGESEGPRGDGVALGRIGTVGHGDGADASTVDHRRAGVSGEHVARAPTLRSIGGRLPPEAIQRVVRASFGAMDVCYEAGLRRAPDLRGRVVVKARIAPDGAVDTVLDAGSDLPDAGVVRCVVRTFATLAFPRSGAGPVTVLYPFAFTPAAARLVTEGR
jgi:hypothetical protein